MLIVKPLKMTRVPPSWMETAWLSKPPPSVMHESPHQTSRGMERNRKTPSRNATDSLSPYCTFTPGATKLTHTRPSGYRNKKRTAMKTEAGAESEAAFADKSSVRTDWTPHVSNISSGADGLEQNTMQKGGGPFQTLRRTHIYTHTQSRTRKG